MSGARGHSDERRRVARLAIIAAHREIALGAVQAEIDSGWLDARHSPLGPRAHVEAVCRRIAEHRSGSGPATAAIVAGCYLLTVDAVAAEYFGLETRCPQRGLSRVLQALSRRPPQNDNACPGREG